MTGEVGRVKLLLSVDELADALSIGFTKAKELVRKGEIVSVRIGDRRLVPIKAAEEYVERLIASAEPRATPATEAPHRT